MEWDKFRRYASWMRQLHLDFDSTVSEEVLHMISANSSNGIMCPGLRTLLWTVEPHTLPFHRLFFSPHLTDFEFHGNFTFEVPVLSDMISMILELEAFPLQRLHLHVPLHEHPDLHSAVSSAVLRCGPSLEVLYVPTTLSDAAVQHIVRLPKLTSWCTRNGPPSEPNLSLSDAFLKLETLQLRTEASLEWLPIFEETARHTSSGQNTYAPHYRGPCHNLTVLDTWKDVSIDATFMSPIMLFHGLVRLTLESACYVGECAFSLTDEDVEEIAPALPRLESATFGRVCPANDCRTTISSLLTLSVCCKNLEDLEIHINTKYLLGELNIASTDPRLDDLPSFPEREFCLTVSRAIWPWLGQEYMEEVAMGFRKIFPSLSTISGRTPWDELNKFLES